MYLHVLLLYYSYAPWCPHCTSFTPVWEEFGKWAENEDGLRIGMVDVTEQQGDTLYLYTTLYYIPLCIIYHFVLYTTL